ncbi:MAG: peptide chain release factor N(5)-glutamine methyltransferase [Alphaproteobacteria bacterium]
MITVSEALAQAGHALTEAGIDSARLDARLLMGHALGLSPEQVFGNPERPLQPGEQQRFDGLLEQRTRRQPLAQIIGRREFWSLEFAVTADTLIPRPDSETLVEEVLKTFPDTDAALDILDLGTGSGCLLLTLLHERPGASGLGIDISRATLDVARANARNLGLAGRAKFTIADWMMGLGDEKFDAIVCNPPYIPEADRETLMPEVAMHEPDGALFAGVDGLDAYRALMPGLAGNLKPGGYAFFEVGAGQADAVSQMLEQADFGEVGVSKDLAGIGRCVHGRS